ncbi:MAG: glutamate-1-semialdehyde 2,1-aminomutase [Syntrophobacterales bacterium]|jgi:glutamate-1-semialdehyde 2,1-aminomutase|nr:glutamate-1-semialdehyde 2,1-aminomutase [Syntrophobacterales bacterium]
MPGYAKSEELFKTAQEIIPGGVNSPVRAWQAVGLTPRLIVKGAGARVFDVDGNSYLDYMASWGPLILGHAAPPVVAAVQAAAARGTSFGASTPGELELAEVLCAAVPGLEMVRLVNSGTEATMSALRLARGVTGRPRVIKFDGCYHGHADSFLVAAGSGVLTHAIPGSPGVPAEIADLTMSLPYNDLDAVHRAVQRYAGEIAALIVEPVAGNMGVVPPRPGFLPGLRQICDAAGILLIFDEVITGFRVGRGGAQALYGVKPDLTCLGKIIGGGLPVGAYGGRRDLMSQMAPVGPIYQAGTLSGNPVAVAAGLATLKALEEPGVYEDLEDNGAWLARELARAAVRQGVDLTINRVGSMLTVFFTPGPVANLEDAKRCDLNRFRQFFQGMLAAGVMLPPSQFEAFFVSLAHARQDLQDTVDAAERLWARWQ